MHHGVGKFPFIFLYFDAYSQPFQASNGPWCATETKDDGALASNGAWGNCDMAGCTPPIEEKEHKGCAEATAEGSEGMGWCATSVGEEGIYSKWDYCMIPDCTEDGVGTVFTTGTTSKFVSVLVSILYICFQCLWMEIVFLIFPKVDERERERKGK